MRITEKGQVTIPKAIRERLGVGPGSEVDFIHRDGEVIVEARVGGDPDDAAAPLRRHIDLYSGSFDLDGMQADDVLKLLRD